MDGGGKVERFSGRPWVGHSWKNQNPHLPPLQFHFSSTSVIRYQKCLYINKRELSLSLIWLKWKRTPVFHQKGKNERIWLTQGLFSETHIYISTDEGIMTDLNDPKWGESNFLCSNCYSLLAKTNNNLQVSLLCLSCRRRLDAAHLRLLDSDVEATKWAESLRTQKPKM